MKFGYPSNRIQSHVEAAGQSLNLRVTCLYLAVFCFINIEDGNRKTKDLKLVREFLSLDLNKSLQTYNIYKSVYRDKISPGEGLHQLQILLEGPAHYKWWEVALWGSLSSCSICSLAFSGSFIDALAAAPLGFIVTSMAYIPNNELFSNIYE